MDVGLDQLKPENVAQWNDRTLTEGDVLCSDVERCSGLRVEGPIGSIDQAVDGALGVRMCDSARKGCRLLPGGWRRIHIPGRPREMERSQSEKDSILSVPGWLERRLIRPPRYGNTQRAARVAARYTALLTSRPS